MTYSRGYGFGALEDKVAEGDEVTLRFVPTSAAASGVAQISALLRDAVMATNHFKEPTYIGWGSGANVGKLIYKGQTRSANYSLAEIAGFMPGIARQVDARSGRHALTFDSAVHGEDLATAAQAPSATPSEADAPVGSSSLWLAAALLAGIAVAATMWPRGKGGVRRNGPADYKPRFSEDFGREGDDEVYERSAGAADRVERARARAERVRRMSDEADRLDPRLRSTRGWLEQQKDTHLQYLLERERAR